MIKTLGEILHDTGADLEGWERKWKHMPESQKMRWEEMAQAVVYAYLDSCERYPEADIEVDR